MLGLSDVMGLSTQGATTCAYVYPDNKSILYASTHLGGRECPPKPGMENGYVWAVYDSYDIFKVKQDAQHRLLYWGVMGAFAMRGAMIFAGAALIGAFTFTNWQNSNETEVYGIAAFIVSRIWSRPLRAWPTHRNSASRAGRPWAASAQRTWCWCFMATCRWCSSTRWRAW